MSGSPVRFGVSEIHQPARDDALHRCPLMQRGCVGDRIRLVTTTMPKITMPSAASLTRDGDPEAAAMRVTSFLHGGNAAFRESAR